MEDLQTLKSNAIVYARLCVRVSGNPAAMLPRLVREVNRVDPNVAIAETITLPVQLDGMFRPVRSRKCNIPIAAIYVLLSAIGLYGVLALKVSRRKKEIGICMALAADPDAVRTMIIREGMAVTLLGSAARHWIGLGRRPTSSASTLRIGGKGLALLRRRVVADRIHWSACVLVSCASGGTYRTFGGTQGRIVMVGERFEFFAKQNQSTTSGFVGHRRSAGKYLPTGDLST